MQRLTIEEEIKMQKQEKIGFVVEFLVGLGIVLTLLFLLPSESEASLFPIDTRTQHFEYTANGSYMIFATSSRTILQVDAEFKPSAGTDLWVYCGSPAEGNEIHETHASPNTILIQTYCDKAIYTTVTGYEAQGAHHMISWVDRNIASSTSANDIVGLAPATVNVVTFASTSPMTFIQNTMSNDLFNGFVLFFGVFFFIVWYFKRK